MARKERYKEQVGQIVKMGDWFPNTSVTTLHMNGLNTE